MQQRLCLMLITSFPRSSNWNPQHWNRRSSWRSIPLQPRMARILLRPCRSKDNRAPLHSHLRPRAHAQWRVAKNRRRLHHRLLHRLLRPTAMPTHLATFPTLGSATSAQAVRRYQDSEAADWAGTQGKAGGGEEGGERVGEADRCAAVGSDNCGCEGAALWSGVWATELYAWGGAYDVGYVCEYPVWFDGAPGVYWSAAVGDW